MTKKYGAEEARLLIKAMLDGDLKAIDAFIKECTAEVLDDRALRADATRTAWLNRNPLGAREPTGWPATTLYPDGWDKVEGGGEDNS